MNSNKEVEKILDKTTAEIRNEQLESAVVKEAASRVWARLAAETDQSQLQTSAAERIEGCEDYQSLIPAYLAGNLSEARSLLLVDHTHECIPCRRALNQARPHVAAIKTAPKSRRYNLQPVVMRWGIAAALVIGLGLVAIPLIQRYVPFGGDLEATVQAAEGQVYQIADTQSAPVVAGDKLQRGEKIRTAKDGHAFVRLGDGSVIEMGERSELSITKNVQGTTVHLDRGAIVIEAAHQRNQHLFVDTGDSLVSVTGTILSVNAGTKGSRVSVVDGEVHMDHAGVDRLLKAGEQAVTNKSIESIAIKDEVAWSKKAASYATTLASLASVNKELSKVSMPGVRNSTHLLDLMPESTVVYAALPNLTTTLTESYRILQERIAQNPALKEWWESKRQGHNNPNMDQVMETVREFGDYLGDEIAVSVSMDQKGEPVAPLVLADLKNSAGFQQFVEQQIAKYSANSQGKAPIKFVQDPLTETEAPNAGENHQVYVWISPNMFAASPKLDQLKSLASEMRQANNGFTASPFHNRIAEVYERGAGLVVAADLQRVIERIRPDGSKGEQAAKRDEALSKLGVLNVKYFVLDQQGSEGKTHTQATLSFNQSERGIPSWLAAPGPMGSLEYISPDANVVAGFVVKNPVALVDDLLGVIETVSPDLRKNLDKLQADHGIDVRKDIAAPLGGEFAFAIDGPILPTPSWKMVFEVNDSAHLQKALEQVVSEVNNEAAKFGKAGLTWDRGDIGGRAFYTLRSGDFGFEVNYAYVNGYMIVGPSRAMVERSIRSQEAGYTLLHSEKFKAGLPSDGNANFSAVFYHNLAPLVQPIADRLASSATALPEEQQRALKSLAADMPPTLAYAYAQGDSITFAANTEGGPFGLSPATLLGMPNALEIQHILLQGMKK